MVRHLATATHRRENELRPGEAESRRHRDALAQESSDNLLRIIEIRESYDHLKCIATADKVTLASIIGTVAYPQPRTALETHESYLWKMTTRSRRARGAWKMRGGCEEWGMRKAALRGCGARRNGSVSLQLRQSLSFQLGRSVSLQLRRSLSLQLGRSISLQLRRPVSLLLGRPASIQLVAAGRARVVGRAGRALLVAPGTRCWSRRARAVGHAGRASLVAGLESRGTASESESGGSEARAGGRGEEDGEGGGDRARDSKSRRERGRRARVDGEVVRGGGEGSVRGRAEGVAAGEL
ncbi:uncharacterized protein SCHCODRAFT_02080417 [Schizophyllum commune H4-8]|uniref:uncharacterized protein n=1 Tax=Schizophyllum commune (strain H4-8 / FGSC 9210) TaxID=578458 RepID=UPI00215ED8A0|nr:uncharacterized protein SCHCODRAFT_02080417 [Schizophyllum commune H4-8]KAI5886750.1 hypothetical protein SCHCODRAFT_02080417 [Schizophyllum commune H4-8]